MAKTKKKAALSAPRPQPQVFEASLRADGSVVRGAAITLAQAEASRKAGQEVVVCGPDLAANRGLAGTIERNANGRVITPARK